MKHNNVVKRLVKNTKKKVKHHNKKLTSIKLGKKFANRYILYYGAKHHSTKECNTNLDVNSAYNNKNKGVSRLNSNGVANIYMKCPKSYKDNRAHIHYLLSDKSNKEWLSKQYEHKIVCHVDKLFVKNAIKNKCYIIINALPVDYYIQNRIPTSISLPYKTKASDTSIKQYLLQVSKNYSKLTKFSTDMKSILNVPIIVYCYKSTCNASDKLIEKLMKMGFTNIVDYKEGILGWSRN
jgi:rhodanese-related sulfurtransferase